MKCVNTVCEKISGVVPNNVIQKKPFTPNHVIKLIKCELYSSVRHFHMSCL